jgi:hypothetical protein
MIRVSTYLYFIKFSLIGVDNFLLNIGNFSYIMHEFFYSCVYPDSKKLKMYPY